MSGEKYIIMTEGLRSILIVMNISRDDLTKFRVSVTNGIGIPLEQDFHISEKGINYQKF